jgi:predicted ribosome quality control (RQC) complex YloA/Tae2 family protein
MREFEVNGIKIYVGQNAKENWSLIDYNKEEYHWFHLESFSSPHVILLNSSPSKLEIRTAAYYCKEYSKYKNYKDIYVIYTQLKNVKKGLKEGEVTTRKTLRIKL